MSNLLNQCQIIRPPEIKMRVVLLDFDGTVLNSKHSLSQLTIDNLRLLSERGIIIGFATGRSSASVRKYLEILQLPQAYVPVICFNGSVCLSINNERMDFLFSDPIPASSAKILTDFATRKGLVTQCYDGVTGEVHACPSHESHYALLDKYAKLVGRSQVLSESYDEILSQFAPAKLLILTDEADALIEDCRRELPRELFHLIRGSPDPFFVEFLLPGVSKGSALVRLCHHLQVPVEQVAAFGDGDNDIEMLSCGCYGVAMRNGRASVHAHASAVTDFDNDQDGVAKHLQQMDAQGAFNL